MSDSKRSGDAALPSATNARAAFANRATTTGSRISALVADAGLSCRFQSILTTSGEPFAEIALLFASDGERSHGEKSILRVATAGELARGAASFRRRATAEFAQAELARGGASSPVRLYLPYYCSMPEVEAIGPPLVDVLEQERMPPARVIVEMLVPPDAAQADSAASRAAWLRAVGVQIAVRAEGCDDRALAALEALRPDLLHLPKPPRSFEEVEIFRSFLRSAKRGVAPRPGGTASSSLGVIVGGLESPDDSLAVESLGVSLVYGLAIAAPRFLC